jgi:uncharacterized protein YndB with AHSA1/START domain
MTRSNIQRPDPDLDLVLERVVDVPVALVWKAWTMPEHLKRWFTSLPWTTVECEIDLRPGGIFRTVMRSPDGEDTPHIGCYLEVIENEKLVWTTALRPGFRPGPHAPTEGDACGVDPFTAVIMMATHGAATRYTATAMHADPAGRRRHADLGFHDGWGTALDQLVALARTL